MADDTPPLPENLAGLVGALNDPPRPPDYHLAWIELGAFIRAAAECGRRLDAAEVLEQMQEIHERYGLPPEWAPKRTESTDG